MPSPFPGMDPFLEAQEWEDFHSALNIAIRDVLSAELRPRYAVRVEHRIYVERGVDEQQLRRADVVVLADPLRVVSPQPAGTGVALAITPVECLLPVSEEHRESRLIIRDRETMEVVTVIETLSPTNKRPGSRGRREYLEKRETIIETRATLVELDLLLGGQRMPVSGLPDGDYFALIRRGWHRVRASVYGWKLPDRLPAIPIPLQQGDTEATIDLQAVVNDVYDRAGYDMTIDYNADLKVPLDESARNWLRGVIENSRSKTR